MVIQVLAKQIQLFMHPSTVLTRSAASGDTYICFLFWIYVHLLSLQNISTLLVLFFRNTQTL